LTVAEATAEAIRAQLVRHSAALEEERLYSLTVMVRYDVRGQPKRVILRTEFE
jgi:hypothetical protein